MRTFSRMVRHQRLPTRFVGTTTIPEVCPRERCGKPVTVSYPRDERMPGTWSCLAGHGGALNARPTYDPDDVIPKGTCQRCRVRPVSTRTGRGGGRAGFCDSCIEEGRRLLNVERRFA